MHLRLQDHVKNEAIALHNVAGADNPADVVTKHLCAKLLRRHLTRLGVRTGGSRARSAPLLGASGCRGRRTLKSETHSGTPSSPLPAYSIAAATTDCPAGRGVDCTSEATAAGARDITKLGDGSRSTWAEVAILPSWAVNVAGGLPHSPFGFTGCRLRAKSVKKLPNPGKATAGAAGTIALRENGL